MAQEARDAAKQVIAGVLQNSKPFNRQGVDLVDRVHLARLPIVIRPDSE
jgi:hypothetical protein